MAEDREQRISLDADAESPLTGDPSGPCLDGCVEARESCLNDVDALHHCLEHTSVACIEQCASRGTPPQRCAFLCDRTTENDAKWTPDCERRIEREKRSCRSIYETCREACAPN